MYTLFLVDDEIELVEGLKELIDWNSYDIQICGDADNGVSALEQILKIKPDIIIMDIKMPKMNGIELLENIFSKGLNSKCIILSGYDDFAYAKKAISLSACNYLLKPCRPSEILDSVLDAKNKLIEERLKDELLKKYEGNLNEYLPIIKKNILQELILKPYARTKGSEENIALYNLKYENLLIFIISIDHSTLIYDLFSDSDMEFIKSSIKAIASEALNTVEYMDYFEEDDDIIVFLSFNNETAKSDTIILSLENIRNSIKAFLGFSVTLALGKAVNKLEDINSSYLNAKAALEFKFFLGDNNIIHSDYINGYKVVNNPYPIDEELKLINYLRTGAIEEIRPTLNNLYDKLCNGGMPTKKNIQGATLSLLGSINKFCIDNDIDINALSKLSSPFDVVLQCETIDELKNQLELIISNIFAKTNPLNKNNSLIKLAINFITANYSKDITLESIAREIHLTPGYISQLFKQETGINFLEFLHKYRVEKSKELLKNKFLKNYEIAYMVGYTNEKHFSKTFKKYTGLTPSQYRASVAS